MKKAFALLTMAILFAMAFATGVGAKQFDKASPLSAGHSDFVKGEDGKVSLDSMEKISVEHAGRKTVTSAGAQEKSVSGSEGVVAQENNNFGSYVSTLANAHVPYAMEQLELDFGEEFVESYTPATDEEPNIMEVEHSQTNTQKWVVGEEYAAQWYTFTTDEGWGIEGHDYVIIWGEEKIQEMPSDQEYDFSGDEYPLEGTYYGYNFDVTHMG